jgi:hypothetical protein
MHFKTVVLPATGFSLILYLVVVNPVVADTGSCRRIGLRQPQLIACGPLDRQTEGYRGPSFTNASLGLPQDMAPYQTRWPPFVFVGHRVRPHYHRHYYDNAVYPEPPYYNPNSYYYERQRQSQYNDYLARQNALNASIEGLNSQMEHGSGNIQLTRTGSNLYVRNYVNYAGDSAAQQPKVTELKAVAKKLQ